MVVAGVVHSSSEQDAGPDALSRAGQL